MEFRYTYYYLLAAVLCLSVEHILLSSSNGLRLQIGVSVQEDCPRAVHHAQEPSPRAAGRHRVVVPRNRCCFQKVALPKLGRALLGMKGPLGSDKVVTLLGFSCCYRLLTSFSFDRIRYI